MEDKSFALSILEDYKKQNKRLFTFGLITNIILSVLLALSISYIVYLLNDIGTITSEQVIEGVEVIENSDIRNEVN